MARKNTRLSSANTTPPAPPTPAKTRGVKKHKKPAPPPLLPATDTTTSANADEDEISTSLRALLSPQDPADALESCRALYLRHGRPAIESHALHRDVAQAMEKAFEKIYDAPGITNKDVRSQLNFLRGKKCEWHPALTGVKLYAWFGKDAVESRRFTDALKGLARMRGDAGQMLGLEDALGLLGEVREQRKAGVRGERIAQASEWTASDCFEAGKLATERFGVELVKIETRRQSPKRKKATGQKADDHGQAENEDCTGNGGRSASDGQDGPEMPHKDTNSPGSNGQDSPSLSGDSDGSNSPDQGEPQAPTEHPYEIDAANSRPAGNGCAPAADNQDGSVMHDQRGPIAPEEPQQPQQFEQPGDRGNTAKKTSTRNGRSPAADDQDALSTSDEDDMPIEQGRQGNQMYEGDMPDDDTALFNNDHDDHDGPDFNSPAPPRTHPHGPSRLPLQPYRAQAQRHDSARETQSGSRSRTTASPSPVATPPKLSINIKTITTEFASPTSTTTSFRLDTPKFLSPEPLQLEKAGAQLMARTGTKRRRTPAGTSHLRPRGTGHVSQWKRTRDDLKNDHGLQASIAHDRASARTFLALFAPVQAPLPQHPQGPIVMNAEMDDGSTITTALLAPKPPSADARDGSDDHQPRWLLALLASDSGQDPPTFTITVYSARESPSADLAARVRSMPLAALDQNQANAIANLSDEQIHVHHLPAVHDLRDDDDDDFIKCLATNVLLVSNHESPPASLPDHLFLWAWMGALATTTSDNRSRISEVTAMVELPEVEMAGSTPFPDHQDGSNCVEDLSAAMTSCKADVTALNGQIGMVKKYEVHLRLLRDCIDRAASEGPSSPSSDAASSSELDVHIAALETLQRDLPAQVFVKAGYDATLKGLREQKRVNSSPKDERALKELQTWIYLSMGEADGEVCRGEKVKMEVVKCLEELVGELQSWLKSVTG
ncbi:Hypothetical predicted protein [Lecanosticta acicola]|uniref:Uncharacterized protein n=1 Tax=Lecanosticta acicola TaxID=111012 RepID=A0AAI8Z6A5_9PEZI|nr:Hypothetical predicted protein [Lecanosticta acicola]